MSPHTSTATTCCCADSMLLCSPVLRTSALAWTAPPLYPSGPRAATPFFRAPSGLLPEGRCLRALRRVPVLGGCLDRCHPPSQSPYATSAQASEPPALSKPSPRHLPPHPPPHVLATGASAGECDTSFFCGDSLVSLPTSMSSAHIDGRHSPQATAGASDAASIMAGQPACSAHGARPGDPPAAAQVVSSGAAAAAEQASCRGACIDAYLTQGRLYEARQLLEHLPDEGGQRCQPSHPSVATGAHASHEPAIGIAAQVAAGVGSYRV